MHIQLEALSTSSGFLKNARLEFSPGLTCIIGARGTCKSTIVETIRFAFDCDSDRVRQLCADSSPLEQLSPHAGMIRATLGSGIAKCQATYLGTDGHDDICIEREIDADPKIYRNGIEELADQGVLHMVEIYSQGDLQKIAQNESLRLELIDRPNKPEVITLSQEREQQAKQLKEIGISIRQKTRDIEVRRADVRSLASLKQQLAELQSQRPDLSEELDQERQAAMHRNSIIEAVRRGVDEGSEITRRVHEAIQSESDYEELAEHLRDIGTPASLRIMTAFKGMAKVQAEVQRIIDGNDSEELGAKITELHEEFEIRNRRYYQLRQEEQEVTDSLKKEDGLKKQIDHLSRLKTELDKFLQERKEYDQERTQLRTQMQMICDKIHALRQEEVAKINERHGDVVILTLELGINSHEYANILGLLLAGSRIHGQDEVAGEISEQFRPCDLVDIVEASDSKRLATALGRDLSQMARLVSHLMDSPELYNLESIVFDDKLEITFFDQGTPKSISELSKGQMATALLPLILRPAHYPLIFDQPEDDLDNSFIYKTLVQHIQRLKLERQLIFVTHNANIPILGDTDSVIVMEMQSPTSAAAPRTGTVDEVKSSILNLLEGGSEAFRLRQVRYESLLEDVKTDVTPVSIDN